MPKCATVGPLNDYLTKSDCAEALNVVARTLDRWHALRTGPRRTVIGGKIYYKIDDINAWIQAQRENLPNRRRA